MPAAYTGSRVGTYKYAQRVKRVKLNIKNIKHKQEVSENQRCQ